MVKNIIKKILERKLISAGVAIGAILAVYFGGGAIFSGSSDSRYLIAQAYRGDLVVSVSGSGQVLASDQLDIKPKTSGDVVYVGVKTGQEVYAGQLIAIIDTSDAEKSVRDAEISLEKAKLSLKKLQNSQTDSISTRGVKNQAYDDLKEAYNNGLGVVVASFLDLPGIMTGLEDMLLSEDSATGQWGVAYYSDVVSAYSGNGASLKNVVHNKYQAAVSAYALAFASHKSVSLSSDASELDKAISYASTAVKAIAEFVKSSLDLIQAYRDALAADNKAPSALSTTHLSLLNDYVSKINKHLSAVTSAKSLIQTSKEGVVNADFDLASQEIEVRRAENSLQDARKKLADCYVRAPFNGAIVKVAVNKADFVSSGTVIATLATKQKIAEISLNEVDAAKVKAGQKVSLTFDALPDLKIAGEVSEIDGVGAISQGVVTYTAKVAFATDNSEIKLGMSVSVDIATLEKSGALLVPIAAVKERGPVSYVELVEGNSISKTSGANIGAALLSNPPRQQTIEVGQSNDEFVEVLSGLNEGDQVIVRQIQATANQPTTQRSLFGTPTSGSRGGGAAGGSIRLPVR